MAELDTELSARIGAGRPVRPNVTPLEGDRALLQSLGYVVGTPPSEELVLGAASVAAACRIPGTVADGIATSSAHGPVAVEHPSGSFTVDIDVGEREGLLRVQRSALLRTARKLMQGEVYATC